MKLREYQTEAVAGVRASFARGRRSPLLVAPTGAGKTQMFAFIAGATAANGKRVVIVVHRRELAAQASRTLSAWDIAHGPGLAVSIGMVGTLANQASSSPAPDLLVFDEGHHAAAATYAKLRAAWPTARVLAVSATPSRLDGKPLGTVYDDLIMGPSVAWLMAQGFLSPAKYYAPPSSLDLSGVKKNAGDYNRGQLADAVDRPRLVGDAVAHYQRLCPGARAICFCVSVAHAQHTAAAFNAAGISAASVDGGMSDAERDGIIAGFGSGTVSVLTSCELIGEGLDVPACSAAILMRPTASLSMHLQQIGRALRVADGKTHATILDMAGNLARHGLAETDRIWSLDGKNAATSKGPPPLSLATCAACYAVYRPAHVCPCCGHEHATKARKLNQVAGELVELKNLAGQTLTECGRCRDLRPDDDSACACGYDPAEAKRQEERREVGRARTYPELLAIGKSRGYDRPEFWARKVFLSRSGRK